jgi:hypothetical protein
MAKSTLAATLNEWIWLIGGTGFTVLQINDVLDILYCQAILATLDPLV